MDNAQKAIMIGVGLFITVLVITVVLLITNLGINTTKKPLDQAGGLSKSFEEQLTTQYDRKIITGQDAVYFTNQYADKIAIVVVTTDIPVSPATTVPATITGVNPGLNNIRKAADGSIYTSGNTTPATNDIYYATSATVVEFKSTWLKLDKNYKTYLIKDGTSMAITGLLLIQQI